MNHRHKQKLRWQTPVSADPGRAVLEAVGAAVSFGAGGFVDYRSEPERGAWWGRLLCGDAELFIKGRTIRNPRQRLASMVLQRGLAGEYRRSLWLQRQNVPTAVLLALGEYRRFGMLTQSLLVFRWVADSRTLADAALAAEGMESPVDRGRLIEAAGALFGRLFAVGAIHKQFHPWNVLVSPAPGAAGMVLQPIDLQHLWVSKHLQDDDFHWALAQASFWLHEPVIDWSSSDQARTFYNSALDQARPRLKHPDRFDRLIDALVARGRLGTKLRRQRWQPEATR